MENGYICNLKGHNKRTIEEVILKLYISKNISENTGELAG